MNAAHPITRTDALVAVLARMLIKWRKPLGLFFLLLTLGLSIFIENLLLVGAFGHIVERQVRNRGKLFRQLFIQGVEIALHTSSYLNTGLFDALL